MFRNSATLRISFTLACVSVCAFLLSLTLGLFPDRIGAISAGRKALCETLAVSCSWAIQRSDERSIDAILQSLSQRNPDVLSAALRRSNGSVYTSSGDHQELWPQQELLQSTLMHMQVPIHVNNEEWGRLELCFAQHSEHNWLLIPTSALRLMLAVVAGSMLGHFLYLRRVLKHLDPSKVIPQRVRDTLDSLAEGLLVLDRDQRIVLANEAFSQTVGRSPEELQGHKASELPWSAADPSDANPIQPWERSIRENVIETGHVLKLGQDAAKQRVLQVTSAPIRGENGENRGAMASFSDVTKLEVRNAQLGETLLRLRKSRDQISERNEQLRRLAMMDPLTQCMNRRAFFEELDGHLAAAERIGHPLSYVIMDIDHFKLINDNHGHKVGDEVLEQTSALIRTTVDNLGLVCRYGGEEFSILFPEINAPQAAEFAEVLRKRIETTSIADLKVTASFGVAQIDVDSGEPLEALDQADQALYFSKRAGRNCVTRWDQIPAGTDFRDADRESESSAVQSSEAKSHIPFTAVSVLLSTLDYRDPETAQHSRRVADLCVAMAAGQMSEEDRYVLEVAALLHDIGKLSVPDAILRKPGPLTTEEWKIMDTHLRLGEKTVKSAFASQALIDILRTYRAAFGGTSHAPELPTGNDIPLAARILHVADAFDAMVSPRAFRTSMSEAEAIAELRRCAGTQFDPEIVQRCTSVISTRRQHPTTIEPATGDSSLRIGTQLETMACAMDSEDVTTLKQTADRIRAIAAEDDIDVILELADELYERIDADAPWTDVLHLSLELLDLCRQTQHTYTSSTDLTAAGA